MRYPVEKHTIEGPNAGQVLLPAHMLAIDVTEVSDEEGVFVTGLAHFMVDGLHTAVEGVANHLLGNGGAIVVDIVRKRGSLG